MMSSLAHGTNTSVEVSHISSHGIWLFSDGKELFMDYESFPWFKDAQIKAVLNVTEPSPSHFYWPDLDVDLSADSIEHPERFPQVFK